METERPLQINLSAPRTPFVPDPYDNRSELFLYNNEGGYISGRYFHEKTKTTSLLDSRPWWHSNNFVRGDIRHLQRQDQRLWIFPSPTGRANGCKTDPQSQWQRVKISAGMLFNKAPAKIHNDGWSFEIFLPYSIPFGKKVGLGT